MGSDMTEQIDVAHITEAELIELVISSIEAFQYRDGPYLEREHCALARKHGYNEQPIAGFWRKAAEQARQDVAAMRGRMSKVRLVRHTAEVRPFVRRITGKVAQPAILKPRPTIISRTGRIADWSSLAIPSGANKLERLTYVPGVVGDMVDWMVSTAKRPNRMMALSTALCVVGTLIGRCVKGPTGSGTHLYVVILAPTGYGKDHPLWCGKTILKAVKAAHLIGPDEFASSPGFTKRLAENPRWSASLMNSATNSTRLKRKATTPSSKT
jgi:hypothetical protein